jgi:polyhydroxyalkanoate synthesis regulator phasin
MNTKSNTKRFATLGLSAIAAIGGLTGLTGLTSAAGAQSSDTESSAPEGRRPGPPPLDAAAKALNLSVDDLKAKLEDGTTTIAQVAQAQGVDVQAVIDAMVADATAHIDQRVSDGDITAERATEIKANLVERITTHVNEGRPQGGPGMHHHPPSLEAAAKALNLSEDELKAKLQDGSTTIAQVAKAQGVDVQTVIDAMVADATAKIDQRVSDGDLTADKAAEIKSNLSERITKLVNEGRPKDAPRPGGDDSDSPNGDSPNGDSSEDAPQDSTSTTQA